MAWLNPSEQLNPEVADRHPRHQGLQVLEILYTIHLGVRSMSHHQPDAVYAIRHADAVLADADTPTYSEAIRVLLALARAASEAKHIDTHTVFKAWRLLDRWSSKAQAKTPSPSPAQEGEQP